jgi:hypothetical protein
MVYPSDKEDKFKRSRDRFFGIFFAFGVGSLFNLLPFLNITDLSSISLTQWLFLGVDLFALSVSVAIYIYYTVKIYLVGRSILKKPIVGS